MLHVASVGTPCCMLLRVFRKVWNRSNFWPNNFQHFRDRRSIAQQFWIRLHSSSNIIGATQAHYTWSLNSYGLYPSHDALQVPTLVGVVAFVCTPLVPTQTHHKLPTLSDYQSRQVCRKTTLIQTSCQSRTKFSIYWCLVTILLPTPRGNAISPKYINIIYEFCLARQKHDVWIAAVPEPCSTAALVELNCLPNLIQKFDSDAVLLRCFCRT